MVLVSARYSPVSLHWFLAYVSRTGQYLQDTCPSGKKIFACASVYHSTLLCAIGTPPVPKTAKIFLVSHRVNLETTTNNSCVAFHASNHWPVPTDILCITTTKRTRLQFILPCHRLRCPNTPLPLCQRLSDRSQFQGRTFLRDFSQYPLCRPGS